MKVYARNLGKYAILMMLTIVSGMIYFVYSIDFRQSSSSIRKEEPKFSSNSQNYEVHAPIFINSDGDFVSYNFSGLGTRGDPYLIEGYNITSHGTPSFGIEIRNTNVFFVIKSCIFYADYIGVGLYEVAFGSSKIVGNSFNLLIGDGGAIVLGHMQNCTISDNFCVGGMQGIHLNYADGCIIRANSIYDSNYQGINIRYSDSNVITYNRINKVKEHGIALIGTSSHNVIHHNILEENTWSDSYDIDGTPKGSPSSQGYDEGSQNTWYDSESKQGNTWSDYFGVGSYQIDGPANSVDLYPKHTTGLTLFSIIIYAVVGSVVLGTVLTLYIFFRKKRKKLRADSLVPIKTNI